MNGDVINIYTDGGSRGNPGKSACGFAVEQKGEIIKKGSKYLGITTNNVAEYEGVKLALVWIISIQQKTLFKNVFFFLDSELIVKQLNGIYKIKNPNLLKLNNEIRNLINELNAKVIFQHVPREKNKLADGLVNEELDNN